MDAGMKSRAILLSSTLLLGCVAGSDLVNLRGDAWQVTAFDDYSGAQAAKIGLAQANAFCAKSGQTAFIAIERTDSDMPGRYVYTADFQCTARGMSPDAQAEYRTRGYQRDCAIAGFALGSPENLKCAADVAAKSSPRAAPAR
jgi:hypothetical protein